MEDYGCHIALHDVALPHSIPLPFKPPKEMSLFATSPEKFHRRNGRKPPRHLRRNARARTTHAAWVRKRTPRSGRKHSVPERSERIRLLVSRDEVQDPMAAVGWGSG